MKKNSLIIIGVLVALFICSSTYSGLQSERNNTYSFEKRKEINYKLIPVKQKFHRQERLLKKKQFI
jgi:hypothetical protein